MSFCIVRYIHDEIAKEILAEAEWFVKRLPLGT